MDRTIDAVFLPRGYIQGGSLADRMAAVKQEFGDKLGGGKLWVRELPGVGFLVAPTEESTYLFPKDHPSRSGEDRYHWEDRGDGVKLGILKAEDEPAAEIDPRANDKAIEHLRARLTIRPE